MSNDANRPRTGDVLYHIHCKPGDLPPFSLLPGDPEMVPSVLTGPTSAPTWTYREIENEPGTAAGVSALEMRQLIRSLKELEVQVDVVPRLYELVSPGVGIHTVEGLPLVGLPPLRLSHSSRLLKRTLDVVLSALGLLLLAPVLLLIASFTDSGALSS